MLERRAVLWSLATAAAGVLSLVGCAGGGGAPDSGRVCTPACAAGQRCIDGTCFAEVCNPACPAGNVCISGQCFQPTDSGTDADAADATDGQADAAVMPTGAKLDLVLEIDNSNSMKDNQVSILRQLGVLIDALTRPPCVSAADPVPHSCDPGNPDDRPQYPAVRDLHVGVVSSDLGTPGLPETSPQIPTCFNRAVGDNGYLNPLARTDPAQVTAISYHLPWLQPVPGCGLSAADALPADFRPASCFNSNNYPTFLAFNAGSDDPTTLTESFRCNAGLYLCGCGLEQQLESVYRALVVHNARGAAGSSGANAGFLREDALLAIVLLTDEEDGSVRHCEDGSCNDARDVYNTGSTAWSHTNPNMRFYMYTPCAADDPTWDLNRYIDPTDATKGFLGLKPGHPERIVFAAIAGVPLNVPTRTVNNMARTDWDALLGPPGPNGPNDFCGRQYAMIPAMNASTEGPISMRQANQDPACAERVVPACRREGTNYPPTTQMDYCSTSSQYFAWPSRRIVEVARRFDEARLCGASECQNGLVASICSGNYLPTMQSIIRRIQVRL
jgi:hypothetical protein